MEQLSHLPWPEMAWPLFLVAVLLIASVVIKVLLMIQDPVYRDKVLYGKPKRK